MLGELVSGAHAAIAAHLGGLFASGLDAPATTSLDDATRAALRRAAQREAADELVAARETDQILALLRARYVTPVVLKGRALAAAAWPRPSLRPAGDLDLLVEPAQLPVAVATLEAHGYRRAPEEPPGLLRPSPTGVELLPPPGAKVGVDLHARLFRSVGHRYQASRVLARAQPGRLGAHNVGLLEDADQLLFVYVHAAKHAVRSPKWLFDLAALAAHATESLFHRAIARAHATATTRAFYAACRLVDRLPPPAPRLPRGTLLSLGPPAPVALFLDRLFTVEHAMSSRPLAPLDRYSLELLLEPSLLSRARLAAGVLERLVTASARR